MQRFTTEPSSCFNSQASASSALLATLSVSATPQDIVFVTNSDFFQSTSARRLTNGLCCTNNIPPPDDSVGARANAGIRDVKIRIPISVEQPGYFYTTNSFVTANGGTNVGVFESSVGIHCCDGTGDCLGECVDQETTLWGSIISEAGTDESGLNVIRVEQGEYVVVFDWKSSVRRITGACGAFASAVDVQPKPERKPEAETASDRFFRENTLNLVKRA